MATKTPNYNLHKIDLTDAPPDITVINSNWDIVDTQIKSLSDGKVDKVSGKGLSTNDYTTTEKNKLAGIASGANAYTLPAATSSALGGVKSGTDITVDSSGNVSVNDDSHNHIISNVDGLQDALNGKSNSDHTHNYAGSSSVGGSATSAVKLDTATAGDSNTPVYFSGGKPVACTGLDLNTSGNAATASSAAKWTTARKITLGGDLTGNVSIDGSTDVTLTATVVDDSHNHVISNVDGLQTALDGKLSTGGGTVNGTLILSKTTDADGATDAAPALIVGGTRTTAHMEIDANEIIAKSNGTTVDTLYIQSDVLGIDPDVTLPRFRNIITSTSDLTAGSSSLATGRIYLVYE